MLVGRFTGADLHAPRLAARGRSRQTLVARITGTAAGGRTRRGARGRSRARRGRQGSAARLFDAREITPSASCSVDGRRFVAPRMRCRARRRYSFTTAGELDVRGRPRGTRAPSPSPPACAARWRRRRASGSGSSRASWRPCRGGHRDTGRRTAAGRSGRAVRRPAAFWRGRMGCLPCREGNARCGAHQGQSRSTCSLEEWATRRRSTPTTGPRPTRSEELRATRRELLWATRRPGTHATGSGSRPIRPLDRSATESPSIRPRELRATRRELLWATSTGAPVVGGRWRRADRNALDVEHRGLASVTGGGSPGAGPSGGASPPRRPWNAVARRGTRTGTKRDSAGRVSQASAPRSTGATLTRCPPARPQHLLLEESATTPRDPSARAPGDASLSAPNYVRRRARATASAARSIPRGIEGSRRGAAPSADHSAAPPLEQLGTAWNTRPPLLCLLCPVCVQQQDTLSSACFIAFRDAFRVLCLCVLKTSTRVGRGPKKKHGGPLP